jgi:hypothetical protein
VFLVPCGCHLVALCAETLHLVLAPLTSHRLTQPFVTCRLTNAGVWVHGCVACDTELHTCSTALTEPQAISLGTLCWELHQAKCSCSQAMCSCTR